MNIYQTQTNLTDEAMRELVLQSDRSLEKRMEEVANQISAIPSLRLIGLTGPTCSGKTTTARLLTEVFERCGRRVHVVSIDDFYYDKEVLQRRADMDPDIEIDYDSEDTIDVDLLAEKAEQLLACKETRMPRFDFRSGARVDGVTVTPRPDDVFLFEGIQILYPKVDAILRQQDYRSIYICPTSSVRIGEETFDSNELRLMRRLVRDYLYRSTKPDFTFYIWQSVRDNEEKSIFPHAHTCNYFIDSTMPYEVGMLKPYLERILGQIPKNSQFYEEAMEVLRQLTHVQPIPSSYMAPNSLYKEFI
ncbi:MAG: hypothetical protein IJX19_11630 [Clostridia bacterium]|nr:hypothetical protein [Clostridia bacterium]